MNDIMDMKISGSSAMPGGEYRTVSISGSGKVQGSLRCESLRCSGSAKVQGDVDCAGEIRCSGSSRVTGDITCQELGCSGSTRCEGSLRANGRVHSSGALKVDGSLEGGEVDVSWRRERSTADGCTAPAGPGCPAAWRPKASISPAAP